MTPGTDPPPDSKKVRTLRAAWTALRVILTLCSLLHHWRDDC